MKILMLFALLMFVIGCGEETVMVTPELEEPSFSYDSRLNHTNLEAALAEVVSNPDFPEVSVMLRPTFPSINIPGTAKADVSIRISEESCQPLDSASHAVKWFA